MTAERDRQRTRPAAAGERRHRTGLCWRSQPSGFRHSTGIFQHDALAEKNPIREVDGDRLVRFGRTDRMRPPYGYSVCGDFFKRFNPADSGCSHADRRDLSAAASGREGLGIKRQISAAFGDVGDRLGRYSNHGLLHLVSWANPANVLRLTTEGFCPIVEPFAKRGISATDIAGIPIRESTSKDK